MQDQRSLLAQFLRFSSATVASLMVFSLYSIVDGLFVAKGVGDYAMAAVNLADQLTKAQEGAENLRRQVKTYLDEASRAKSEAAELRRKLQNAQNQNNRRG